ncbi:hypothetical protein [Methylobacter tundripaludum]|nr:hypothetical protein [Methylobacter tundripaludum]
MDVSYKAPVVLYRDGWLAIQAAKAYWLAGDAIEKLNIEELNP